MSAILCTNHCRSHADENFVAPSTYHQISKGVDGDERERYMGRDADHRFLPANRTRRTCGFCFIEGAGGMVLTLGL